MAEKVIIIGSGPAGLSAAIYSAREGFSPLVLGGSAPGGQLLLTTIVENMPGFPDGVLGYELIERMRKQAEKFGARFTDADVESVDFKSRPLKVTADGKTYEAGSVIIATGAKARMLDIESERKYIGRGVSTCATCDGAVFKGKNVIVVGGGDTAMEDAEFLTRFANEVTIVHRRDSFRASKIMQDRVLANKKIKVVWNSTVDEIKGDGKRVTSAVLKNLTTNEMKEMPIDGVFLAIGYVPSTKIFGGQLDLDDQGYIVVKDSVRTSVAGVFVAGDVADRVYRQASTASASGVKAAIEARAYLSNNP
jgi:thioredoxin reductase (NADPH)